MPNFPRTDLAVEAEAIHRSAAAVTELPGVRAEETERRGFAVTEVHVLDVAGKNALCKPIGDYYTLALDPLLRREDDAFENAAQTLAELLRGVLPLMPDASVLVVGLGNRAITPDAVGPDAIDSVMVTRHLREQLPEHFGQFRSVAALAAGVLGIPVAAIGLPTVIDAGGFSDDPRAEQMFVTPRDIDTVVRDAAKLIGYGINLALHDGLTIGDVDMFLS